MRRGWTSVFSVAVAVLLLNVSLAFRNVWPTPGVTWTGDLSIEVAAVLLGLLVLREWGWPMSQAGRQWLSAFWIVLVVGRYVEVTAPALWGRELNLYRDLRFIPDVAAMFAQAAQTWVAVVAVAAVLLALVLIFVVVRWSLTRVAAAIETSIGRRILLVVSAVVLAAFVVQGRMPTLPRFASPVIGTYARQVRFVANAWTRSRTLPPSPSFDSDLSRVKDADVLLFFIESYGAVAFERPEFAESLRPHRAALEADIRASGHAVVSGLVGSPTFGGSSWLAHITLLSGLSIGDPDANALLMTEHRETLPMALGRQGYRTVAMMPGLWYPWPEGAFYGFNEIYNGTRLAYTGPPFGWWSMPDQFTLAKLDQLERDRPDRPPLFVFFPTVSTHTPFSPRAPYQPDWPRVLTDHPFDDRDVEQAWEEEIDWMNLGPSYAKSVAYAYDVLGGYLKKHTNQDFVMILIGDHQPPALVSGEGAPWDVPVHVVTNRLPVLEHLRANGFNTGLTPSRPSLGPMDALLPMLLDAFGGPDTRNARLP